MATDDPPAPGAEGAGASLWALGGQGSETRDAAPGIGQAEGVVAPAAPPAGPLPGLTPLANPLDSAARNAGGEYHAPHAPPGAPVPAAPASRSVHVPDNETRRAPTMKLDRFRPTPEVLGRVIDSQAELTDAAPAAPPPARGPAVRAVAITVVLALAAASGIVWLNHRKPVAPTVIPASAPAAPAPSPAASAAP